MADRDKTAERKKKRAAYRQFARSLKSLLAIHSHTAADIYDCLNKAHWNQAYVASSELSRQQFRKEFPETDWPDELSGKTISRYFTDAGHFYGDAASLYVRIADLPRAFKYFRKAAVQCRRAAELQGPPDSAACAEAREYKERAALVRHELARESLVRRTFSLGLLKRRR